MSQLSGLSVGPDNKTISSHRLDSITPDSNTPQSGSPASETGYSPHSQPFAQRPTSLTSAGAAVRQSASTLPSPPPFTPGTDVQSVAQLSPVAFASYSAGSCDSRGFNADTPGVSSAWAGSSTKAAAQQTESFAFNPPSASATSSPDVEQFQGASTHATPQPLSELLGRAAQNMATSADMDQTSEASETASRSSATSRGSRRIDGQSPGDLLRKAKAIFEKRAAIEGSSRLRHNRKNALKTPMDKGIPTTTTPQNTPMDAAAEQHTDQASPVKTPGAAAAAAPGTPGSVTGPDASTPQASPASPADRIMVSNSKALSPPDSNVSVVSIGSVCPTAADVSRKLEFSGFPQQEILAMPVMLDVAPAVDTGSPISRSPMPLDKLMDSMQDSATKRDLRDAMDGNFDQLELGHPSRLSIDQPDLHEIFGRTTEPEASCKTPRSWLAKTGSALLWLLALLGICAAGMLAVEMLPPTIRGPGVLCLPYNRQACLQAQQAFWMAKDQPVPGWRIVVKRVKWGLEDAWDMLNGRRPRDVTEASLTESLVSRISEQQQRTMSLELAQRLFSDMSPELVPSIIAERLAAAGNVAAGQQPPEDLIAVGGSQPVSAEQQQPAAGGEDKPVAEEQQVTSPDAAQQQPSAVGADGTAAAVPVQPTEAPVVGEAEPAVPEAAAADQVITTQELPAPEAAIPDAATAPEVVEEEPAPAELQKATGTSVQQDEQAEAAQQPQQQPAAFEEQTTEAAGVVQPEQQKEQEPAVQPEPAAAEAPAVTEAPAAPAAPEFKEDFSSVAEQQVPEDATPSIDEDTALDKKQPVAEHMQPSGEQREAEVSKSSTASSFWSYLPYMVAALATALVPAAAYYGMPLIRNAMQPQHETGETDETAEELEGLDDDGVAAAEEAAAEAAVAAAHAAAVAEEAARAAAAEEFRFSDEEAEAPAQTPPRRRLSAAAMLDAAMDAGASTLDRVNSKILRFKSSPLGGLVHYPVGGRAVPQGGLGFDAADGNATAADEEPAATPRGTRRGVAAGRTPRRASSRRTTSAAEDVHDDGDEVSQPPSTGKGRRTVRGRKSVLPEVPEDKPADDGAFGSKEERAAVPAPRTTRRRQSATAVDPDAEAGPSSGRGRRRSAAAAEETTPSLRPRRSSSRHSQG